MKAVNQFSINRVLIALGFFGNATYLVLFSMPFWLNFGPGRLDPGVTIVAFVAIAPLCLIMAVTGVIRFCTLSPLHPIRRLILGIYLGPLVIEVLLCLSVFLWIESQIPPQFRP